MNPGGSVAAEMPLHPTVVVTAGVELTVSDDGELSARYVDEAAVVGQLGIALPEFQRKNPLPAGRRTGVDWARLGEATIQEVSDIIDGQTMAIDCPPTTTVGDRLIQAMLAADMDIPDLIRESGVSKATIYKLKNCKDERLEKLQFSTLLALQRALRGCNGWWLVSGQGEPPHGNDSSEDPQG